MSNRIEKFFQDALNSGAIERPAEEGKQEKLPVLFVAPLGTEVPNDELLSYVTFNTFVELLSAPEGAVVLFREDQKNKLATLCADAAVFERDVRALFGLPATEYKPWFDEATFQLEKVSYAPLVSEIRIADEVEATKEATRQQGSTYQQERKRTERKDGSVRYHENIGVYNPDEDEDDEGGEGA
jgi:hypothetical protein